MVVKKYLNINLWTFAAVLITTLHCNEGIFIWSNSSVHVQILLLDVDILLCVYIVICTSLRSTLLVIFKSTVLLEFRKLVWLVLKMLAAIYSTACFRDISIVYTWPLRFHSLVSGSKTTTLCYYWWQQLHFHS